MANVLSNTKFRKYKSCKVGHERHNSMLTVCIISNSNSCVVGYNDGKTSPKYKIEYEGDEPKYHGHAEMRALGKMPKSWNPKKVRVHVQRFKKDGSLAMSRPCDACQAHLWRFGIDARRVTFTNHEGLQEKFR